MLASLLATSTWPDSSQEYVPEQRTRERTKEKHWLTYKFPDNVHSDVLSAGFVKPLKTFYIPPTTNTHYAQWLNSSYQKWLTLPIEWNSTILPYAIHHWHSDKTMFVPSAGLLLMWWRHRLLGGFESTMSFLHNTPLPLDHSEQQPGIYLLG